MIGGIDAANAPSIGFHERFGFERVDDQQVLSGKLSKPPRREVRRDRDGLTWASRCLGGCPWAATLLGFTALCRVP